MSNETLECETCHEQTGEICLDCALGPDERIVCAYAECCGRHGVIEAAKPGHDVGGMP